MQIKLVFLLIWVRHQWELHLHVITGHCAIVAVMVHNNGPAILAPANNGQSIVSLIEAGYLFQSMRLAVTSI
jgi:hypothetical protein